MQAAVCADGERCCSSERPGRSHLRAADQEVLLGCLLYTSDAADELTRVDMGGGAVNQILKFNCLKLNHELQSMTKV